MNRDLKTTLIFQDCSNKSLICPLRSFENNRLRSKIKNILKIERSEKRLSIQNSKEKHEFYRNLNIHLKALVEDETDWLANCANFSALLFSQMPDINWAGFYFLKNNELVLGPFQGKPACIRIPLGKGVCGTAAVTRKIQVVEDVHQFEGHIACDEASKSEIVLPILYDQRLIGVLDIDSAFVMILNIG